MLSIHKMSDAEVSAVIRYLDPDLSANPKTEHAQAGKDGFKGWDKASLAILTLFSLVLAAANYWLISHGC